MVNNSLRTLLILLLLPFSAQASCTVGDALRGLRPGADWSLQNNDYATIVWNSVQTLPTAAEVQAYISDCPNQTNLQQRKDAITTLLNETSALVKLIRAILLTLFDENNNTREWIQAFKVQVSQATSLADLKTRVAALPDMPDRTLAQANTAVQNKLNSGASD